MAVFLGFALFAASSAKNPEAGLVVGFFEFWLLVFFVIVAAVRWMFGMTFVQANRILRDYIDSERRRTQEESRSGADAGNDASQDHRNHEFREGGRPAFDSSEEMEAAYALLRVKPSASDATLRRAHHTLVRQLHPDLQDTVSVSQRARAEERLKLINAAHTLIVKGRRRTGASSATNP